MSATRVKYMKYLLAICGISWMIFVLYNCINDNDLMNYYDNVRLEDILDQNVFSDANTSFIFFHETSNNISQRKFVRLNSRQGCSVESAARINPDSKIFLLYATSRKYENDTLYIDEREKILNTLLKYKNVKILRADLKKYTQNTPLKEWYETGALEKSKYLISHTSDVLRYLTLWKYGGTYLDLDVIVTKHLEKLGKNYAAAESDRTVAAGIMNLDYRGQGHKIADMCVSEIKTHFRGNIWGYNGPGVITRVLKKLCKTDKIKKMTIKQCKDFTVLSPSAFYPVYYEQWKNYFEPKKTKAVLKQVENSYGIHVWNKLSSKLKIKTNKDPVAYGELAKKFCPNVYRESGDEF